jgi:pyruvate/2-oxoglutarate dehydrogenase complex dihydrolipoamide dehydrogenase (E3) component
MYDITFIGYGIATMCALLALSSSPLKIAVIDPFFDGGSLHRHYATVHSNTTWQQFLDAVAPFVSPSNLLQLQHFYEPQATTTLGELTRHMRSLIKGHSANRIVGHAKEAHWLGDQWTINVDQKTIKSSRLILCTGSHQRTYNYPIPQLPLEVILNSATLKAATKPLDSIVILGASHSGTLAAERAAAAGLNVSLVYRNDGGAAFKYARDGHYDGIKQESAQIADKIMAGEMPTVRVICEEDSVRGALLEADWITYACGFVPRKTIRVFVEGVEVAVDKYDASTGKLIEVPNAWGFGIAYPNSNIVGAETYYDVSLAAFLTHISRNLSAISR